MNWGGVSVLLGLIGIAISTWPWGLLIGAAVGAALWALNTQSRDVVEAPGPQASGAAREQAPSPAPRAPASPPSPIQVPTSRPDATRAAQKQKHSGRRRSNASAAGIRSADHFARHATTPGALYVFRNDLHAPDLYKVGYTTVGTSVRLRFMNDQVRGVTGAVGEFRVVYERAVPESYNAEQQVFERLAMFRARSNREFFQAPLGVITSAIDAVADEASGTSARRVLPPRIFDVSCPDCGRAQRVTVDPALQQVELSCPPCGHQWSEDAPTGEDATTTDLGAPVSLQAWSPPGMDPALAAVMVPRGEVTEAQWWTALADRLTAMVLKAPDPEAAMLLAAQTLDEPAPDSPQQTGEALVQHNLNLRTAMTLAVMAERDPFPVAVEASDPDAAAAIDDTDLGLWLDLAAPMVNGSRLN